MLHTPAVGLIKRPSGDTSSCVTKGKLSSCTLSTVQSGLRLLLSNTCSVSIYWKEMLAWPVSRLDWVQRHKGDNENSSSKPKFMYLAPRNWALFEDDRQIREMRALGVHPLVVFPCIAEFPPRRRHWQHQQPGAESCCPVESSRHRG